VKFQSLSLPTAAGVALSGAVAAVPALAENASLEPSGTAIRAYTHLVPAVEHRWAGGHRMRDGMSLSGQLRLAGTPNRWTWRPIPGDGWVLVPIGWATGQRAGGAGPEAGGTERPAGRQGQGAPLPAPTASPAGSTSAVPASAQAGGTPQTGPVAGSAAVSSQSQAQGSGATCDVYRVSPGGKIVLAPVRTPGPSGANLSGEYRVSPSGKIYFSSAPVQQATAPSTEATSDTYRVSPSGKIYLDRAGGSNAAGAGLSGAYRVSPSGKIYFSAEPIRDTSFVGAEASSDTYRVNPSGEIYLDRAGGSNAAGAGLSGAYRVSPSGKIYFSAEPIRGTSFVGAEASSDTYRVNPSGEIYLVQAGGRISEGAGPAGVYLVSPSGKIYFSSQPVTRTSLAGAEGTTDTYRVDTGGQIYLARAEGAGAASGNQPGYYRVSPSGQIYFAPTLSGTTGTVGLDINSDSYRVDPSGAIYLAHPPSGPGAPSGAAEEASPQAATSTEVAESDSYRVGPGGDIYLSTPQSAQPENPEPVAEPLMEPSPYPLPAPAREPQSKPWWEFWK